MPVWYLYLGGDRVLFFSQAGSQRLKNIGAGGRASLNFNTNATGGNVSVLHGTIAPYSPTDDEVRAYLGKYEEGMKALGADEAHFRERYNAPLLFTVRRPLGW